MTTANTRSPRSASKRESETRRKPWAPPALLETPVPPPGYKYRWLRTEMMGHDDKGNMSKRLREGYELVHPDEVKGQNLPSIDDGAFAGVVGVGGLVLGKIPVETAGERQAYYADQTQSQLSAIDNELAKQSNPVMPIGAPNRKSDVSFGNPDNKPSMEDENS